MSKLVLLAAVMVLQVCLTMADTPHNTSESEGVLQRVKEAYEGLKTKAVNVGSTAAEFIQMYYEEQVKPVTDPYIDSAKEKAKYYWDKIRAKVLSKVSE